ncbi:hypothetical protein GXB85_03275 [Cellulomonas sp. APG4]|nr:hypothetical protein [Cellulomonas sp. APG4]
MAVAPLPARAPPAPGPAPAARPRLAVVHAPRPARTRAPFVLMCMALLAASLLGALVLNTSMAQGEYDRYELQSTLARSAQQQQELTEQLDRASASPALAQRATELGMVPAGNGGYLRLSDGAVLGDPRAAEADG